MTVTLPLLLENFLAIASIHSIDVEYFILTFGLRSLRGFQFVNGVFDFIDC